MRCFAVGVVVAVSTALGHAENFKVLVNLKTPPLSVVTRTIPGIGYVDDPTVGGDKHVLENYRHSGAWTFKTKKCDDATLAFLDHYRLSALLVLEGGRDEITSALRRIHEGGHAAAVAGFLLGDDPTGGGEADSGKWRAVVAQIAKRFPDKPIGIPVTDANSPMRAMLADEMGSVTHLCLDLTGEKTPYEKLRDISKDIAAGHDKPLKACKFWLVGPDRKLGAPLEERDRFETVMWKMHWMMAAFAAEKVDAVFFNQPAKPDDFGRLMRFLWMAFYEQPNVRFHGESKTADHGKSWIEDRSPDLDQNFEDLTGGFGGKEHLALVPTPKACISYGSGKDGDVEYLLLEGGGRISLVMVNSTANTSTMTVDLVGLKSGNSTNRRLTLDPKTRNVEIEAIGGYCQPGLPFRATIRPYTVQTITFILTSENYNKAGY